jgi:hypothetical protein
LTIANACIAASGPPGAASSMYTLPYVAMPMTAQSGTVVAITPLKSGA